MSGDHEGGVFEFAGGFQGCTDVVFLPLLGLGFQVDSRGWGSWCLGPRPPANLSLNLLEEGDLGVEHCKETLLEEENGILLRRYGHGYTGSMEYDMEGMPERVPAPLPSLNTGSICGSGIECRGELFYETVPVQWRCQGQDARLKGAIA